MFKPKGMMFLTLVIMLLAFSCSGPESDQPLLTADVPLHLEEHLEDAKIEGSEVPEDVPALVEWRFDEPQPDWKPVVPLRPSIKPLKVRRTEDALQLILTEVNRDHLLRMVVGGIYIDLPGWHREHWAYVLVRARTSDKIRDFFIGHNLREQPAAFSSYPMPFRNASEEVPVINDGSVQTYLTRADWSWKEWKGPWKQLGVWFVAAEPASIDILSVSVIPKEASHAGAPAGVSTEVRSNAYRRTLYTHVPGRLEYKVRVPKAGRIDVGLGVLRKDVPVTFRITAKSKGNEVLSLLEETYADREHWAQRSVDLSGMSGQVVTLAFEADAERAGTVALWAAPTLTGARSTKKPNIIFYIIDGAGADHMSIYGYNRRTTPNLERLAAEGAIFEHAFSNCTWTKISNPSFMTSLYNSVLGGHKSESDPLPDQAVTMAQYLHRAGYQTAVFTSNAYCGTLSSFDRGVDVLREAELAVESASSKELHEHFWKWRGAYPNEPYWVHFQTTDVHWPWKPVAPFSGLFISPEQRQGLYEWERQLRAAGDRWGWEPFSASWEKTGISQLAYSYVARGLYDETMAHNDHQIGQLVKRLKKAGEWDHTLLIVAADHGHGHAGLFPYDPLPPRWWGPILASYFSRIPMIFVWPERIAPGQRFSHPVSMIDMLPTILDLADLPMPEVIQGQSLAPLLLREGGWEPRPVILEEFEVDRETGELSGAIEVVDGRWGASLWIGPELKDEEVPPEEQRPAPLMLYDLWNDPYCIHSLHEERPDLVKKYTRFLQARWKEHRELGKRFSRSGDIALTPEQLRTLRSLGYIK